MAKKTPNDEAFIKGVWFDTTLSIGNISGQQKAAMALSKLGKRQYTLWAVASIYLSFKYTPISDLEKRIFPQLASRLLQTVEPITSPQEAYLKALVYQLNEQYQELAEYLLTDQIKKWDLLDLNIILIETLEIINDWGLLKAQCIRILKDLNRDDFNHWKALIKSCIYLNDIPFLREFISEYKASQNSKLALVHFAFELENLEVSSENSNFLNEAVEEYFRFMSDKRSVFNDLITYITLDSFDRARWIRFLENIVIEKKQHNLTVNVEKFKFFFRQKKYDSSFLIKSQVDLYNKSKHLLKNKDVKDYHTGDDHLLIGAYSILEHSTDFHSLQKAAVLLETGCRNDNHQFYIRLWLVRIYLLLGAFSKAFLHYRILKVQKLQIESMSHFIISRAMTLFPKIDPLVSSIDTYQTFDDEIVNGLKKVYDNGVFTQLESFTNLRHVIDNSLSKRILHIQLCQLSRYSSQPEHALTKSLSISGTEPEDHRDFDVMWDIPRPNCERLSATVTLGPRIGTSWVRLHELKEEIISNLLNEEKLTELSDPFVNLMENCEELTEVELWSFKVVFSLLFSAQNKLDPEKYDKIFETLTLLNFDEIIQKRTDWKTIHHLFVALDTALVILKYIACLHASRNQIKYNQAKADELKTNVRNEFIDKIFKISLQIKNNRAINTQGDVENISSWSNINQLGLDPLLVENVVDSIYASQDESLTLLRTKKI